MIINGRIINWAEGNESQDVDPLKRPSVYEGAADRLILFITSPQTLVMKQ